MAATLGAPSDILNAVANSLLSTELTPLSSYPPQYCSDFVNAIRQTQHDYVVKALCHHKGSQLQDESQNNIQSVSNRFNIAFVGDVQADDLKKTPDAVFYDGTILEVYDVTLTEGDPIIARERKITKYSYWRALGETVVVDALAIRRNDKDIGIAMRALGAPYEDILMASNLMLIYSQSMDHCRENPDFLVIESLLNGEDPDRKVPFSPVDVDFNQIPENVINQCFGSRKMFDDYIGNKGIFEGFTNDSIDDHVFYSGLIARIEPMIQEIMDMDQETLLNHSVNKDSCKEAVAALKTRFDGIEDTYCHFSKSVPIPLLRTVPSLEPKTATVKLLESMRLCTNDDNHLSKILLTASSVFTQESKDVFIGGFKIPDGLDLKQTKAHFSNTQIPLYRQHHGRVIGKRTIRFDYEGIESGLTATIARVVGIGYLDFFGKDKRTQRDNPNFLSWDHDLSKVDTLVDWFIAEGTAADDSFLDGLIAETKQPLFDDIRSESVLQIYNLFSSIKRTNVFALAEFYDKVYKEIAFLAEVNTKKVDISFSSLGTESTLLVVYGGQQLSRMNSKRYIQLASLLQPNDDFPFKSAHSSSVHSNLNGDDILYTDPISVDCLNVAHHMVTKKFVYDICLGLLLDSSRTMPLSRDDRICYFFTNTILRFNNDKSTSDMIMDLRYVFMSLNGIRAEIVKMTEKMHSPCRKEILLYFYHQVVNGITDWFDSARECKVSLTNMDTEELATKASFPRLLGPGSNLNITEAIVECYVYSGVSKETRSRYHAMAAAFNKLTESSAKYYDNFEKDPSLVRGFSETSTYNYDVIHGTGLTTFSMKAVDLAGKLIRDSIPLNKVKKSIMTGKLSGSVSEFATNKSMVKERLSTTLSEEFSKSLTKKVRVKKMIDGVSSYVVEEKTVIKKVPQTHKTVMKGRAKEYEWLNGCADLRFAECDMKSKAVTLTSDLVFETKETSTIPLVQNVVKKWFQAYLTLFPKNQYGKGGREIAIQDFETRVNNFFFEKVSESICQCLEEETISKASSKYFMQESISKEFLNKQFTSEEDLDTSIVWLFKTFFLNEDHTRWGPSTNALLLAMLMRPSLDPIDPKLFNMVLFAAMKMMDKKIEIPKEIFTYWTSVYDSGTMDSFQKTIYEDFAKSGEITFSLVIGMMQGIYNLGSSVNAVAKIKLARKIMDTFEITHGIQIITKALVGSDDKETIGSARIAKIKDEDVSAFQGRFKAETIRSVLIFEKIEEVASRLLNMKKSGEKSIASVRIGEYNSNFLMDDSVVSRRYIEYGALSSNCKAISYGTDVTSGFNGIVALAQHGISEVNCLLFQLTLRRHLDSIYNFGSNESRDIEKTFGCKREFCPVELGGFPILTISEMITGLKHNAISRVLDNGSEKSVKSMLRLLSPKNSLMVDAELDDYSQEELSSSIGLNYMVRLNSKVGNITRHFEETYGSNPIVIKDKILNEPWLPFVDPIGADDFLLKMGNRVFSFQSKVAFSYENDISNMIRMARMSSSKVCYIGPHLEKSKIKPEMLKSFMETVKEYADESVDPKYNDEIAISRIEIGRLLSSNDSFSLLHEYSSSHMLGRDDGRCITRRASYKRATCSSVIAMKNISTKNKPLNVIIAKWYPEASDRSRDLIKNKDYLDRDFEKIVSRFTFLRQTVEETSIFLFGFSNAETDRASFNTAVNVLRSNDRARITLLSNVRRVFVDDEFFRLLVTRNIYSGSEYSIVRRIISTHKEDSIRENYCRTLEQIAVSMSSGLIYIQNSNKSKEEITKSGLRFLEEFTSSSISTIPIAMTKLDHVCRSFSELLRSVSPTIFMSLPMHDKVKKALVCAANIVSQQLGMEYEDEYQAYSYALSVWYIKEQRYVKKKYDVSSDCKVGITYRGDRNLAIETRAGLMTITIDRKEWGPSPDITIPMKVLLNNTFTDDSCRSVRECLDKDVNPALFEKSVKTNSNVPVVYMESGRIFVAPYSVIPVGTLILSNSIVKFAKVITTAKIEFTATFSGLVESNSNFSLGRIVEGRFVTVYDITSQLFDPASLIANGDRKIGVLGEIESIFTDKPIDIDLVSLKIPLLASKIGMVPRYEEFRIVPENWDDVDTNESVSAADAEAKEDDDFDLDFFEFETTGGDAIESAIDYVDNDFADLTDMSFKPGQIKRTTRQRVRFTESYCNIVRRKLDRELSAIEIIRFLSRTPRWFEAYATRFVIENARQIINKYKDEYSEDPKDSIRSAVNRSISVLLNVRADHLYVMGDAVRDSTVSDLEIIIKRSKMFKKDCFERYFGAGRDVTIKEYYPLATRVFFDSSDVVFDEL